MHYLDKGLQYHMLAAGTDRQRVKLQDSRYLATVGLKAHRSPYFCLKVLILSIKHAQLFYCAMLCFDIYDIQWYER